MKNTVLVVDDELLIRKSLSRVLREKGYAVEGASTGAEGLEKVDSVRPQVMILDMRLPDTDGLSVLRKVRQMDALVQVIVITAYGDVQSAVEAMKLGACDFLRKPYEKEDIEMAVEAAARTFRQANELDLYRRKEKRRYTGEEIIGTSAPMQEVRDLIEKVVRSQATSVFITGESGTGKELVARAIHYRSDRAQAPLMEVNCSSFQETLLENELFGHEKGAFSVDIRIVAASNKDLESEVRTGRFRSDLYFRLKVVSIHLPPLSERGNDVLLLARHFLREFSRQFQKDFRDITPDAARLLVSYRWPGNVRELRNLIERVVLLEDGRQLEVDHLPAEVAGRRLATDRSIALPTLAQIEADHIAEVLRLTAGNKSRAARVLGISRQVLIEKLRRSRLLDEGGGRQVS